jgi:hypothetical protein
MTLGWSPLWFTAIYVDELVQDDAQPGRVLWPALGIMCTGDP